MSANPNAPALDPFAACEAMAAGLPTRVIPAEDGPYLTRYTIAEFSDGSALYLHFFHRGDAGSDLHDHPWSGRSRILAGGYVEERCVDVNRRHVRTNRYLPGAIVELDPPTLHRVDLLDLRGCWTLFEAGPKRKSWGFWDRITGAFTPWRDGLRARGLLLPEKAAT